MADLATLCAWLDRTLNVDAFRDASHNGLQVANGGRVRKVCCGVDASLQLFEEARRRRADLVVCHHGISWGDSLRRIAGLNHRRVSFLIRNDMALYACHLPLDAHPRCGNNILICRALGLRRLRPFGLYNGTAIGFAGELPGLVPYETLKMRVGRVMAAPLRSMDFGRSRVRTVAVVSGGAADELAEAGQKGIDVYITGEPKLSAYHVAREYGLHAIFAGHYATETFGVRAVAGLIARRWQIEADFADLKTPF